MPCVTYRCGHIQPCVTYRCGHIQLAHVIDRNGQPSRCLHPHCPCSNYTEPVTGLSPCPTCQGTGVQR